MKLANKSDDDDDKLLNINDGDTDPFEFFSRMDSIAMAGLSALSIKKSRFVNC